MKDTLKTFYSVSFVIVFLVAWSGQTVNAAPLPAFEKHFSSWQPAPQKKESENFSVSWVHPRDEVVVDFLLQHMEAARLKLSGPFGKAMKTTKVPVEIYPNLQSFSEVSGLSLARFRATGTIALTLEQRLMILSPRNLTSGYSWAETAVHEYIHYLIREISPDHIPIWLHEGTAQLFQSYPYDFNPQLKPSQWGLFKRRRESNKLLSLVTLREPFPYRETPEEAELAYIQSFLFVRWLDQKCGIVSLIESVEKQKSVDKALESCVGVSLAKLEESFRPKIMAEVQIPAGQNVEWYARDFSGRDPMEVEGAKADRKARNFAQLSTELFKQGRYQASSIEMNKALMETPISPPSWRRHLALVFTKAGKKQEAEGVIRELLKDYPEDAAAWYLLGLKQIEQQNWKEAWSSFLHSFYQNPFLDGLLEQMEALRAREPKFKDRFLLKDL